MFWSSQGAVSLVLDSLDDIHCLQEAPLNDRDFLHSVLEDRQLHALLEVSTYSSAYILCMVCLFTNLLQQQMALIECNSNYKFS